MPNAIEIEMKNGGKFLFTSFSNRDEVYMHLQHQVNAINNSSPSDLKPVLTTSIPTTTNNNITSTPQKSEIKTGVEVSSPQKVEGTSQKVETNVPNLVQGIKENVQVVPNLPEPSASVPISPRRHTISVSMPESPRRGGVNTSPEKSMRGSSPIKSESAVIESKVWI